MNLWMLARIIDKLGYQSHKILNVIADPILCLSVIVLATIKTFFETYIFDDWQFLIFLTVLIIVDTALAVYKAIKDKSVSSDNFSKLFDKLIIYAAFLILTHVLTHFTVSGQNDGLFNWFDSFTFSAIIIRECISITENARKINKGFVPDRIAKYFEKVDHEKLD